jgi:hypothetical protein
MTGSGTPLPGIERAMPPVPSGVRSFLDPLQSTDIQPEVDYSLPGPVSDWSLDNAPVLSPVPVQAVDPY